MLRFMEKLLLPVLCIGLVVGATACAKKAAETPAAAPAGVSVTGVDLGSSVGSDKRVSETRGDFGPKDVIYASVLTSGSSASTVLKARWTYQDGQVVDESEQTIAPTGDAATEFHVSKADGWPVGKYKVEVLQDGNPVQSKEFEVK
jgi:hypothetical protein